MKSLSSAPAATGTAAESPQRRATKRGLAAYGPGPQGVAPISEVAFVI
jgi:hypothetical protein